MNVKTSTTDHYKPTEWQGLKRKPTLNTDKKMEETKLSCIVGWKGK
jgi:hypothetical protein